MAGRKKNEVKLSKRLEAVAAMVTKGNIVCDVGCDHGFVPVYLVLNGISPSVIAMDVGEGPLMAAKRHISDYLLSDYIETRLSDGLTALQAGEADTVICAGMGGRLTVKILEDGREKAVKMKELILQPQSDLQYVREYLRNAGYAIADENMVLEDGKYYPMMRVCPEREGKYPPQEGQQEGAQVRIHKEAQEERRERAQENMCREAQKAIQENMRKEAQKVIQGNMRKEAQEEMQEKAQRNMPEKLRDEIRIKDKYGPVLLQKKHPVLKEYLKRETGIYRQILENLCENGNGQENRRQEILEKRRDAETALSFFS